MNTGMGALSSVRLTEQQQRSHQRNLLLARAAGGPPWLSRPDARAIVAVRLLTFLTGDAGRVGRALPAARRLPQLRHRAGGARRRPPGPRARSSSWRTRSGRWPASARCWGRAGPRGPRGEALRDHGLAEFGLGPKEGIALIQGVPGATALAVLRLGEAAALASLMEAAAALSIAVIRAPRDPYRAACGRGDDVLAAVLARLRAAAGDEPSPRSLQAPVSFRVAGPVLAQVHRAAALLEAAVRRALTGVTDSPAYLDGRFTGTAGFHGIDLAAHCDHLTAAFCHAAEVAAARLHRLLDPAVTGLPAQLARDPGPQAGLTPVHKRAAGEVHAMRRLAAATPVGLIETSGGQEDVQSFAWEAAEKLRAALRHARAVTACELLAGYQAAALSGPPPPAGSRAAAGLAGRDRRSDRGGPAVRRGHRAADRRVLAPGLTPGWLYWAGGQRPGLPERRVCPPSGTRRVMAAPQGQAGTAGRIVVGRNTPHQGYSDTQSRDAVTAVAPDTGTPCPQRRGLVF